ncbi:hypothetical protein COY95_03075 [Candidatus Woesearchaeota archaeon CG_4_10_14_0_8_um_filter_47_5]|nr:MAG: hypothetical protein COY95_03075 [Candidatus Woesearchaeota archaeon CG_4_10_14_0_8_um_filter_47_5]
MNCNVLIIGLLILVIPFSGCVKEIDTKGKTVIVTTEKESYFVGEMVNVTIINNLDFPFWHDNSCSIGPCSYQGSELKCIRLVGIDCPQSKLDPGKQIILQYARPIQTGEVQFTFFYIENRNEPPLEYKEALSNMIEVKTINWTEELTECFTDLDCEEKYNCSDIKAENVICECLEGFCSIAVN